jgi:hypothetical protein
MATKLIRLRDGTLIEAEVSPGEATQISGGAAEKVGASLDQIQQIMGRVGQSLAESWRVLSDRLEITEAEIELGLSFEGEGNLFITKAKAGANLVMKVTVGRPKS